LTSWTGRIVIISKVIVSFVVVSIPQT